MENHLVVSHISRQFDPPAGPHVLQDVSFDASPGQTLAIVGPSGSGKSTLLNILGSLDQPTAGTVHLGSLEVTSQTLNAVASYRASHVGFVFQDHHLLPQLSGFENVLLPSLALRTPKKAAADRASDLLQRVGIADRAHAFPAQLSGGERQRVAIARALINSPRLLLCDEPTGNLDHDNALRIVDLFIDLAKQQQLLVIMVTHNLQLAARFDRCLELAAGKLVPTRIAPTYKAGRADS